MDIDIKQIPKSILTAAAAIVVCTIFIGLVFIYIPFENKAKEFKSKISVEKDKNDIIARINTTGKRLEFYSKSLPEAKDTSWLLKEISRISSEEGIETSSIESGDLKEKDLYSKLNVTLNVYASYHQLGVFLSRVESEEKFFRIESLNMKRLDLDSNFENLTERFKPFDVKANIVISTVILR